MQPSAPKEVEEKKEEPLSFNYGTLVDIVDSEDLIRPVVPENPEIFLDQNQVIIIRYQCKKLALICVLGILVTDQL